MFHYQAFMALQIADERVAEAKRNQLVAQARAVNGNDRSIRRSAAVAFASISSFAAFAARRLDECVAADLAERLGPDRMAARN
jgi:hypothetical protein